MYETMFVLTLTTGEYSDSETHVVGIFDSTDAMTAIKEAHRGLSGAWLAWEVPRPNEFFEPYSLASEGVLTQREIDEREERVKAANAEKARRAAAELKRVEDLKRKRADCLAMLQNGYGQFGPTSAAPLEVLEHLKDLSDDVNMLLIKGAPTDTGQLAALRRRLAWELGRSDELRCKLTDAADLAAFDRIIGALLKAAS